MASTLLGGADGSLESEHETLRVVVCMSKPTPILNQRMQLQDVEQPFHGQRIVDTLKRDLSSDDKMHVSQYI